MSRSFLTEGLPAPLLSEPLDYEDCRALRLQDIATELQAGGPFDTDMLETELVVTAAQRNAWGDMFFRALGNAKGRAAILVQFAFGADLDLHAASEGLTRFPGESDEALQERVILERKGISVAGPDDYFIRLARNTDGRVRDVAVSASTENDSIRLLTLAILSTEPGGIASPGLLAKVTAALDDPKVRPRFVRVQATVATVTPVNIKARFWKYPTATVAQVSGLEAILRAAFAAEQRLGWDLTRSWIVSRLHVAGIQRVEVVLPTSNLYTAFDQAPAIGTVTLEDMGYVE